MTLYLGKKAVCPTKIVVKEVPAQVNNQDIAVTENGTYTAEDGYTGLGTVEVNVATGAGVEINNQDITVVENGTYTADEGYTGLGTVEVNVPTGGAPATKFGASVDAWFGDVNEVGWLYPPTAETALDFTGVTRITGSALKDVFHDNPSVKTADFGTVQLIDSAGLRDAFYLAKKFMYANFDSLEEVAGSGLNSAFRGTALESLSFPALKIIRLAGFEHGVRDCTALTSIYFSALETAEQGAFRYAFQKTALTSISFPALTNVNIGAFQQTASSATSAAFRDVPTLTEIHFRADAQAAIEATYGYSSKWGATNADILFDL